MKALKFVWGTAWRWVFLTFAFAVFVSLFGAWLDFALFVKDATGSQLASALAFFAPFTLVAAIFYTEHKLRCRS